MKSRTFFKKLSLNKKTIAHLDSPDMGNLKAGIDPVTHTCSDRKLCENTYTCTVYTHCYYPSICILCEQ